MRIGELASRTGVTTRTVRYYEDLIFQALPAARVPVPERDAPVGG